MADQFDVIEHQIIGDEMQAVVITLDPGERVIAEAGAMLYMNSGIEMQMSMGEGTTGMMGKVIKAAGTMLTGESFFITTFTNLGQRKASVAFAAPYPGKIVPLDLAMHGNQVICQKDAFLCAAGGTEISVAFQKNLGAGLYGGEGFIFQKISGGGMAFAHAGGTVFMKELHSGETLRVDAGCIVCLDLAVQYNIKFVGGFKNALFGCEGLSLATLTGPGRVYLQTLPFSRLAERIVNAARHMSGRPKDGGAL
jgi:uncharacterized protein (TIGR00266 family)